MNLTNEFYSNNMVSKNDQLIRGETTDTNTNKGNRIQKTAYDKNKGMRAFPIKV